VKRLGLAAAMTVVGLNIYTGSPLLALWVGSRAQGSGPPSMGAVGLVVLVMGVTSVTLAFILSRLGSKYDELAGTTPTARKHAPWLRSMRGEREQQPGERVQLTMLERILVGLVVVAFAALEVWFFFFSGSPIGAN
jgi:hypothetical protein